MIFAILKKRNFNISAILDLKFQFLNYTLPLINIVAFIFFYLLDAFIIFNANTNYNKKKSKNEKFLKKNYFFATFSLKFKYFSEISFAF